MPFTVTMPKLSPTMEEGVIAKWHKKEGDKIEPGELLMEVSTDKATVEHNALDPGYLRKVLVQEGESAATNEPIAIFTENKDESLEGYEPEGVSSSTPPQEKEAAPPEKEPIQEEKPKKQPSEGLPKPLFVPTPPLENYSFNFPREKTSSLTPASPLARKLAAEKRIDLSSVKGTGPKGRVMSRDLDLGQSTAHGTIHRNEMPELTPGTYEEEQLSPMRKVVGQRLQEAKTFIPHFYVRTEVDAEELFSLREQLKNEGIKFTYNDFVIKACSYILTKHPEINSGYNTQNDTLIRFKTIDISVAVTIDGGLITPIIRHADYKAVGEISAEMKTLAKKARDGKLEPHEYQGGSFTVSNMGMFDVTDFQAIINPPQAAILAVGAIQDRPVIKNHSVAPGKIMNLVLSVDHRVVDGVAAAKFLQDLKNILENPAVLVTGS